MLHDVDAAVRDLLQAEALAGTDVEVTFEAPTRDWASRRSAPTLNCYLFDVREDVERRRNHSVEVVDDEGIVVGRRRFPRTFTVRYMIGAYAQRPEDEHRILSAVLACLVDHEVLPADRLQGELAEAPWPIRLFTALPNDDKEGAVGVSEVWMWLNGEFRPTVELDVMVPVHRDPAEGIGVGPPVREQPRFAWQDQDRGTPGEVRARRRSAAGAAPTGPRGPAEPADARARGRRVPATQRRRLAEEEITGGPPDEPGRRVRVAQLDDEEESAETPRDELEGGPAGSTDAPGDDR